MKRIAITLLFVSTAIMAAPRVPVTLGSHNGSGSYKLAVVAADDDGTEPTDPAGDPAGPDQGPGAGGDNQDQTGDN